MTEDHDLYLAGIGSYLGDEVPIADSDPADDIAAICIEKRLYPPQMAVHAAADAVAMAPKNLRYRAGLHAYVDYQGAHFWQAAPYVAAHTVGPHVPTFDIVQECNGALGSLELARAFLRDPGDAVLITAADRFDSAWVNRLRGDQSMFGDGAGAVVLTRGSGDVGRILAMHTTADNTVEGETRGAEFYPAASTGPLDFPARVEQFHTRGVPILEHYGRLERVIADCLATTLEIAGVEATELAYVLPTTTTHWRMRVQLERFLGLPPERSTWAFGRRTGHLGAADQLAGLVWLRQKGALHPGDRILLFGGGSGYTITCAIIEVGDG